MSCIRPLLSQRKLKRLTLEFKYLSTTCQRTFKHIKKCHKYNHGLEKGAPQKSYARRGSLSMAGCLKRSEHYTGVCKG